jgi:hypothetical protein
VERLVDALKLPHPSGIPVENSPAKLDSKVSRKTDEDREPEFFDADRLNRGPNLSSRFSYRPDVQANCPTFLAALHRCKVSLSD